MYVLARARVRACVRAVFVFDHYHDVGREECDEARIDQPIALRF